MIASERRKRNARGKRRRPDRRSWRENAASDESEARKTKRRKRKRKVSTRNPLSISLYAFVKVVCMMPLA